MKREIRYAMFLIGSGLIMLSYLHATFLTKAEANTGNSGHLLIREQILFKLNILDKRIYEIHKFIMKK